MKTHRKRYVQNARVITWGGFPASRAWLNARPRGARSESVSGSDCAKTDGAAYLGVPVAPMHVGAGWM